MAKMKFERNQDILRMHQEGKSLRRIAMKHGISHVRVRNIIRNITAKSNPAESIDHH